MALTATQLAQNALNVAISEQQALLNGTTPTPRSLLTVYAAIALLAEALIAVNSSNTATVTLPPSILTGRHSATASTTAPIQTGGPMP